MSYIRTPIYVLAEGSPNNLVCFGAHKYDAYRTTSKIKMAEHIRLVHLPSVQTYSEDGERMLRAIGRLWTEAQAEQEGQ